MSNVDGKIMAGSFWSHIVCFMFMSIWFSTMCFTSFSIVSLNVHVVQHTVLKFILSTKVFKHVLQIILPTMLHCFGLQCQASCAENLCHGGGQPWHVHCILGYTYAMHFVLQEPPPDDDEAWSTETNECQPCFNLSFRFHLTLNHLIDQQRLVHQTKWLGT